MSDTNGRIDYGRLVSDIDFANVFEGTRFEQYTDTKKGLGSILGGWLGAIVGRFVGLALGQVAQELLVDELLDTVDLEELESVVDLDRCPRHSSPESLVMRSNSKTSANSSSSASCGTRSTSPNL